MVIRLLFISLVIVSIAGICNSQTIVIKPYLQNASPTEIVVMWEVDASGNGSVFVGDTPFNLNTEYVSSSVIGNGSSQIHTAVINGLNPGTKYYYKVVMEDLTETYTYKFLTPPLASSNNSVQIVAMSDMQRDGAHPDKFKEIVAEGIIPIVTHQNSSSIEDLEAVLIPGDLVPTGGSYNHWKDYFFNKSDSLFSYVPLYPVLGNHEYSGVGGQANFLKYFYMPLNGPVGMEERVWYKDLSNIRMIGFDSNANGMEQDSQLTWLQNVLTSTCSEEHIDFVFAELHHPHLSELWTPGESDFTGEIIEMLEDFTTNCNKASIHFFGHTHGYSRGHSRDDQHLWVNVATAGGAIDNWGEFPNADYEEFVKSQDEYGFVLLEVEAGLDPLFRLKRYGRGDQDQIENNILRDEILIRNKELGPKTPTNVFPNDDTLDVSCILLQASQFDDNEDVHQASHWQIAEENDFVNTIILESWKQSENWYNEVNTQANDDLSNEEITGLTPTNDYFWRVRYRDQYLKWSDWSTPSKLIVSKNDTVSTNLLVNGTAENGLTAWFGDIEVLTNAECGSVPPFEGLSNFGVGGICVNEMSQGIAYQVVDLKDFVTDIDADQLSMTFGGYMRNFSGNDLPEAYLEFYDGVNGLIATTNSIRNDNATWTRKSNTHAIPVNSRRCRLVLKGTRSAGTDNDSYFDLFSMFITERGTCENCIGNSNIDFDGDGYCDDIDCVDNDQTIYPGAVEICDLLDNNCDGKVDLGDTIRWSGGAMTSHWSNDDNWDQLFPPLPCQYVIIDSNDSVLVDGAFSCKGILVETGNLLIVDTLGSLLVNGEYSSNSPCMSVSGSVVNNGRCVFKNSSNKSLDLIGEFTNNGVLQISKTMEESIFLRDGAVFKGDGKVEVVE